MKVQLELIKLQLINGISNDLHKLVKYFNSTTILTLFLVPATLRLPIIFDLYLNYNELLTVKSLFSSISSLLNRYKLPEVSE